MISGIYRIRNIINDKSYYGSSKDINKRWNRHKNELNKNKHGNILLQRSWNKYGKKNFIFEIVEECDINLLLEKEQYYLDENPEFNIGKTSSGGDNLTNNPNKNEIIKRIKESSIKRYDNMSDEERKIKYCKFKEKNPNWKGGSSVKYCKCGKEIAIINNTCIKCRNKSGENNPFYNKKHTDKTKEILSKKHIGKYNGNQNIPFSINGKIYNSLGEASKELNIPITTIRWRIKSNNVKYLEYKYINI